MKRFFIFLGLTVLALFGIFAAIGLSLPNDYRVERTIVISAETPAVHAFVGDLKQWDAWTPWKTLDPDLTVLLGEQTEGVGATQSWDDYTGGGRLEFTASEPASGITYDLYFADFPKVEAAMEYKKLVSGDTEVTWWMEGTIPTPVVGGIFASVMDAQVGPIFEIGLTQLKEKVEESRR